MNDALRGKNFAVGQVKFLPRRGLPLLLLWRADFFKYLWVCPRDVVPKAAVCCLRPLGLSRLQSAKPRRLPIAERATNVTGLDRHLLSPYTHF